MKLHQLQALVASAETGSIRAAARSLGISQAAVTRALRELEAAEQLPLLIRAPEGISFTEYGKALLTHARLVLNQMEHAQNELARLRNLSGAAFDQEYVREIIEGQRRAIDRLKNVETADIAPDLRALIQVLIPTIRSHLEMAQAAQATAAKA